MLRQSTRRLLYTAAAGAAAFLIYTWYTTEEEEQEEAERPPTPPPRVKSQRRPSFSVRDEQGGEQGAVADERAQSWGWLVDVAKPADGKAAIKGVDAMREANLGATEPPPQQKKSVKFRLDDRANFYGFVYNESGKCVAHGADPSFVGLHLTDVLKRTRNTDVDGHELHRRFVAAAEQGGGWVSYAWRHDSSSSIRLKGAYITPLKPQWGQKLYGGVGYSLVPPPPDDPASGMYGFVCDSSGRLLAHGASAKFVGRTLAQVIAATGNDQIDSENLLHRFKAAARLGGGWVTYPWRNDVSAPLRQKGAYISRIERPAYPVDGDVTDGNDGKGGSSNEVLLAGVGYFGELSGPVVTPVTSPESSGDWNDAAASAVEAERADSPSQHPSVSPAGSRGPPVPPPVPPSAAAAKAATVRLKAMLGDAVEGELSQSALEAVVSDASGSLAAAAAEVTCWEATELPPALAGLLKEHATGHIASQTM